MTKPKKSTAEMFDRLAELARQNPRAVERVLERQTVNVLKQVAFRLPVELLDRVGAIMAEMLERADFASLRLNRTDVVRLALIHGCSALERELEEAKGLPSPEAPTARARRTPQAAAQAASEAVNVGEAALAPAPSPTRRIRRPRK